MITRTVMVKIESSHSLYFELEIIPASHKITQNRNNNMKLIITLIFIIIACAHAYPWTDTFTISGVKSYNPNIDINPGPKLVTIYYQNVPLNSTTTATTQRVRFDTIDQVSVGSVVSTTIVFAQKLYYVNLVTSPNHFCIFEHLYVKDDHSSFRLLPSTKGGQLNWTSSSDVKLIRSKQQFNATSTSHIVFNNVNVYQIDGKSYIAQAWLYYALGYTGTGEFFNVIYYENADNGYPLRFEAEIKGENGNVVTTFDVSVTQFYEQLGVNAVFSDDLFNQNVKPSCH
jgi:hypothetical protein